MQRFNDEQYDVIYAIPDGKNFYVFKDVIKNNIC